RSRSRSRRVTLGSSSSTVRCMPLMVRVIDRLIRRSKNMEDTSAYKAYGGCLRLQGAKFESGRDDASAGDRKTEAARGRHPQSRACAGGRKGGVQPGWPGGEPGDGGEACRRRDRDIVSPLPNQGGSLRGGLPA